MSAQPPPLPIEVQALPSPRLARTGLVVALVTIVACIGFVLHNGSLLRSVSVSDDSRPSAQITLMARYLVGVREFLQMAHQWNASVADELSKNLDEASRAPADLFRIELIKAALTDGWPEDEVLDELGTSSPELVKDIETLHSLRTQSPSVNEQAWQRFHHRHGWIAKLARAQATDWKESGSDKLRRDAMATAVTIVGAMMFGLSMLAVGIVLLIKAIKQWRSGAHPVKLLLPGKLWAGCLLEAFAIYLFCYTVVLSRLRLLWPDLSMPVFYLMAFGFVVLAALWPLWRGMRLSDWRQTLGLHRGQGWRREMMCGLAGWVTGLPLLAVGGVLSMIIAKLSGHMPTHPITEEMLTDEAFGRWFMIILAVVFAPLVEETMFRGLLFPGLSALARWLVGALLGAFVFAVIHPQGWAGVPAIMAIALTLTALRTFRGSLIAPMTAHALNNGLVSLLLLLLS